MKNTNHSPAPKRGGKGGKAHKQWAAKRMNRPTQEDSRNRGYEVIGKLLDSAR